MHPRHVVTLLLGILAAVSIGVMVTDAALNGAPGLFTILAAAMLTGAATAWPMATRHATRPIMPAPRCGECGEGSWLSTEFGFCVCCGSGRVWQAV